MTAEHFGGQRLRVGVIGLGHWGPNILRNHADLGSLAAFCDTRAAARAEAADRHPDIAVHDSATGLIADQSLDAVAIATPAATHGALVHQALAAGKHVFVEKPLCLDIAEAEQLSADAAQRGLILMVGHLLLYHPAFRALRELAESGGLGALRYIYSNRLSLGKFRQEENALWSFAPHDISMILALTGCMPDTVSASGAAYLKPGIPDTTLTRLSFPRDVSAHIFVSWLHPYKDHRMVVVGSQAMAVFNDVAAGPDKLLLYRHRYGWDGDLPVVDMAEAEPVPYEEGEPLRAECAAFLAAIRGEAPPPSDADEGVRVLRVLDACQRAIGSGDAVILAQRGAA